MSATAIDIHVWIEEQKGTVPAHIHPSAQGRCHELINEMHHAAEVGDNGRLVYLLQVMRRKIDDETVWEKKKGTCLRDTTSSGTPHA